MALANSYDVCPTLTINDSADFILADAKHFAQLFLGDSATSIKLSYFTNFIIAHFRQWRAKAKSVPHFFRVWPQCQPSFFDRIAHVICVSSKKKMRWITVNWVVAFVKDKQTGWNFSESVNVCSAMASYFFCAHFTLTISRRIFAAKPRPTIILPKTFNIFPKTICCRRLLRPFSFCSHQSPSNSVFMLNHRTIMAS